MGSKRSNGNGPDRAAMVARILAAYDAADDAARAYGERWYRDAHRIARQLATMDGHRPERTAAAIAALSPRLEWVPNVRAAIAVARAHHDGASVPPRLSGVFTRSIQAAWRALDGMMGGPGWGPKVRCFACNIRTAGAPCDCPDGPCVTIDSIAARVPLGLRPGASVKVDDKRYQVLAEAYRRAAAARGVLPTVMQAVVWVAVRGAHRSAQEAEQVEQLFEGVMA